MKNNYRLIELEKVDSTNNYAKELLKKGLSENTVICARVQEEGRGRFNRAFMSSSDFGLWFSIVLFPEIAPEFLGLLACTAAVAVCRSIEKLISVKPTIKWPNDVEVSSKKVCGILPESAVSGNDILWTIIGIGVNISAPEGGFVGDLADRATCLMQYQASSISKVDLLNLIVSEFFALSDEIKRGNTEHIINLQREYSSLIGEEVFLYLPDSKEPFAKGVAIDFGEHGEIIVKADSGELTSINYGEVSLRKR